MQIRDEIIQCAQSNVEECRNLERRRLGGPAFIPGSSGDTEVPASLPNVDDPRFLALLKRDEELDGILDSIGTKVHALHEIAIEMGNTAKVQSDMIDDLDEEVTKTNKELVTVNKKLRDTLTKVEFIQYNISLSLRFALLTSI